MALFAKNRACGARRGTGPGARTEPGAVLAVSPTTPTAGGVHCAVAGGAAGPERHRLGGGDLDRVFAFARRAARRRRPRVGARACAPAAQSVHPPYRRLAQSLFRFRNYITLGDCGVSRPEVRQPPKRRGVREFYRPPGQRYSCLVLSGLGAARPRSTARIAGCCRRPLPSKTRWPGLVMPSTMRCPRRAASSRSKRCSTCCSARSGSCWRAFWWCWPSRRSTR